MWSEERIEQKKIDGFPVCPFARKARLQDKIQFLDCRSLQSYALEQFDRTQYEIGIAWLGDIDDDSVAEIEIICEQLAEKNPDLLYFTSTIESLDILLKILRIVFLYS